MRMVLAAAVMMVASSVASAADWPPVEDYINVLSDCSTSRYANECKYTKASWPDDYKAATSGDYQGQRNVAFCLSTGCDGAIRINKILGCAWRFVILESGHLKVDSTDTSNLQFYCGPANLDQAGLTAAEAQAKRLLTLLGE